MPDDSGCGGVENVSVIMSAKAREDYLYFGPILVQVVWFCPCCLFNDVSVAAKECLEGQFSAGASESLSPSFVEMPSLAEGSYRS